MEIRFRVASLRKAYEDEKASARLFGSAVARKYIQRINLIAQAKSLNEVMALHGLRCHPLKGQRKGQYAVSLDFRYRLIFTVSGETTAIVWIEEVSKHYDD